MEYFVFDANFLIIFIFNRNNRNRNKHVWLLYYLNVLTFLYRIITERVTWDIFAYHKRFTFRAFVCLPVNLNVFCIQSLYYRRYIHGHFYAVVCLSLFSTLCTHYDVHLLYLCFCLCAVQIEMSCSQTQNRRTRTQHKKNIVYKNLNKWRCLFRVVL